ncbi:DUF6364 family protein [Pedobacter alpinus]|uniref:DUF6364 family protein n=1 Tax=Pedobacter alpinus TaxID=1590643 RepID=A0ABW5TNA2_9SPHI
MELKSKSNKLTLKLSREVVEKAKQYASEKNISVSSLIENYLKSLTSDKSRELQISPFVKRLSTGIKISADYDYKKDYVSYLTQKHS